MCLRHKIKCKELWELGLNCQNKFWRVLNGVRIIEVLFKKLLLKYQCIMKQ